MTEFLKIADDALSVEISHYGAALARVWLRGQPRSLVLGLPAPEDYADAPHAIGVIVGPIAGRISQARVRIHGRDYRMEANTPPDCLHSGSEGVQHRRWDLVEKTGSRLTLRCALPDGACGLPGNREITATYEIVDGALTISIAAQSDADTLMNLASHAYWTLDGAGDLATHRLSVGATRMVETGADLIPTGRVVDVTGGPFDFSTARDPTAGPPLDGCFCLERVAPEILRPVLRLQSARSGLALHVESNQPGVVLYSAENLPSLDAPPKTPPIGPFSALAIEPQGWPDAPNHADFPSILIRKSDKLINISRFSFRTS